MPCSNLADILRTSGYITCTGLDQRFPEAGMRHSPYSQKTRRLRPSTLGDSPVKEARTASLAAVTAQTPRTWTHDGCKLAFGEGSVNRQLASSQSSLQPESHVLMRQGCADARRRRDSLANGASMILKSVSRRRQMCGCCQDPSPQGTTAICHGLQWCNHITAQCSHIAKGWR